MASRIHVLDFDGDALFWGQSAFGAPAPRDGQPPEDGVAPANRPDESFTVSEPPTVRSGRSWDELEDLAEEEVEAPSEGETRDVRETGEVPIAPLMTDPMTDGSGIVVRPPLPEPVDEGEDEPCPETLRSPVSTGVSTSPRRSRVA